MFFRGDPLDHMVFKENHQERMAARNGVRAVIENGELRVSLALPLEALMGVEEQLQRAGKLSDRLMIVVDQLRKEGL